MGWNASFRLLPLCSSGKTAPYHLIPCIVIRLRSAGVVRLFCVNGGDILVYLDVGRKVRGKVRGGGWRTFPGATGSNNRWTKTCEAPPCKNWLAETKRYSLSNHPSADAWWIVCHLSSWEKCSAVIAIKFNNSSMVFYKGMQKGTWFKEIESIPAASVTKCYFYSHFTFLFQFQERALLLG